MVLADYKSQNRSSHGISQSRSCHFKKQLKIKNTNFHVIYHEFPINNINYMKNSGHLQKAVFKRIHSSIFHPPTGVKSAQNLGHVSTPRAEV